MPRLYRKLRSMGTLAACVVLILVRKVRFNRRAGAKNYPTDLIILFWIKKLLGAATAKHYLPPVANGPAVQHILTTRAASDGRAKGCLADNETADVLGCVPRPESFLPTGDDYFDPSDTSHAFDEADQNVLGGLVHGAISSAFLGLYLGARGTGPYFAANRGVGSGGGTQKPTPKGQGEPRVQAETKPQISWEEANRLLGRDIASLERELKRFDGRPVGDELRSVMAPGLATKISPEYNLGDWQVRAIARLTEMKQNKAITEEEWRQLKDLVVRVDRSGSEYWKQHRDIDVAPDDIEEIVSGVEQAERDALARTYRADREKQLAHEQRRRAQVKNSYDPKAPLPTPTTEPQLRIANPIPSVTQHLDGTQAPGWRQRFNSYFRGDRFQQLEQGRVQKQWLADEKMQLKSVGRRIDEMERILRNRLSSATDEQQRAIVQQKLAEVEQRKRALAERQQTWDAKKREWDEQHEPSPSPNSFLDDRAAQRKEQRRNYKLNAKLRNIESGLAQAKRRQEDYQHRQALSGTTIALEQDLQSVAGTIQRLEARRAAILQKLEQD